MASPSTQTEPDLRGEVLKLIQATRGQTAAILAAAMIAKVQRPMSVREVVAVANDILFAMYPAPGTGSYDRWKKTNGLDRVVT